MAENITLKDIRGNSIVQNFEQIGRFLKPEFNQGEDAMSRLLNMIEIGAIASPAFRPAKKFLKGLGEVGGLSDDINLLNQLRRSRTAQNLAGLRGVSKRALRQDQKHEDNLIQRILQAFNRP